MRRSTLFDHPTPLTKEDDAEEDEGPDGDEGVVEEPVEGDVEGPGLVEGHVVVVVLQEDQLLARVERGGGGPGGDQQEQQRGGHGEGGSGTTWTSKCVDCYTLLMVRSLRAAPAMDGLMICLKKKRKRRSRRRRRRRRRKRRKRRRM